MLSPASSPFIEIPAAFLESIATDSERVPTLYFSRNRAVRKFFWMRLRLIHGLMQHWTRDRTRCLDFCGGGGVFHPTLAAAFGQVTFVDLESHEASLVKQRYQLDNVLLVEADISTLHLPRASFPNIVAADVLEHFVDLAAPVARIRDWLAPGGVLFTSLPTENFLYVFLRKVFGIAKPVDHYHTAREVERYLEENGFRRRSRRCVPFVWPVLPLFSICVWEHSAASS